MTAGQEFLNALVELGLVPAFLGWGWDPAAKEWQLVLVTSILEAGGPLRLSQLLFKAYNAKATPKEISPFIVRFFSPEIIPNGKKGDFWFLGEKGLTVQGVPGKVADARALRPQKIENVQKTFMGLELEMKNSYQTFPGAVDRAYAYRRRIDDWSKFKRNVERLAA